MTVASLPCGERILERGFELRSRAIGSAREYPQIFVKDLAQSILSGSSHDDLAHGGTKSFPIALRAFRPLTWPKARLVNARAYSRLKDSADSIRVTYISAKSLAMRWWHIRPGDINGVGLSGRSLLCAYAWRSRKGRKKQQ